MLTPFLFELRTVIDWMSTETSLVFSEWVRVEAIYAQVFEIKCLRRSMENDALRGMKRPAWKKFFVGGGLTFLLMGVIWIPLILFAFIPSLGQPNIPTEVTASFEIGGYMPLYKVEVAKENIHPFTEPEWKKLVPLYDKQLPAKAFLEDFSARDVVATTLSITSSSLWNISPPNLEKMIKEIETGKVITCRFNYKISRTSDANSGTKGVEGSRELKLNQELRERLFQIFTNESKQSMILPDIFPKFLAVRNNGNLLNVRELLMSSNGKS